MSSNASSLENGYNSIEMNNISSNSSKQDQTSHLLGDSSTKSLMLNEIKNMVGIGIGSGFLGSIPSSVLAFMLLKGGLIVTNSNVAVGAFLGASGGWGASVLALITFAVITDRADDEEKRVITLVATSAIGAFVGSLTGFFAGALV